MSKPDVPSKPTSTELDVLQVLWHLGPSSVKQVHRTMQIARPDLPYANVLRLMQVMHSKGLLIRDESERSHVYAPAESQKATQGNLLRDLIHKAFAGSGKALILAALQGHVSREEREEIENLLREDDR
ncbi:BlaI/MecI/CopY family transcriptional regulator [Azospirillum endophyticum]